MRSRATYIDGRWQAHDAKTVGGTVPAVHFRRRSARGRSKKIGGNVKSITSMALCAAGTGLAVALVCGGCATTEPRADHYVPPPLGSNWTYLEHNTGSFNIGSFGSGDVQMQVTEGQRMWEGRQVLTMTSAQRTLVIAPDGAWLAMLGADGRPLLRWDPPLGFEWPLVVGKTWTENFRIINAEGQTIPANSTWNIEAYGDVTVAAGTFKAFKVVYSDSTGRDDTSWFCPDLGIFVKERVSRSSSSPFGAGTQERELVSQNIRN
jgi:hypothetical protein